MTEQEEADALDEASWNGKTYRTDKITHGMMPDYERIFGEFRDQPVRLLEIGVADGGSCKLWSDFFHHSDSRVVGLDLYIPESQESPASGSRIALCRCDQNDSESLRAIAAQYGPFDIVIDDGAHRFAQTRNCFRELFQSVRDGGYYVIEDWGVGYIPHLNGRYGGRFGQTMVTLITDIMRSIPSAQISGYQIILEANKSLAFFRKGPPWRG